MTRLYAALALTLTLGLHAFAQTPAPDILGDWSITTLSPIGENTNNMTISRDSDGALKADAKSPQGQRPYDSIAIEGTQVTIVMTIDYEGSPMVITYVGTTDGKVMNGSADFGGLAQGSFSAARLPADR